MAPSREPHPDWFLRSRLKMRHVQLVVAVDDDRSVHKAASRLHMTQPAATKLLSEVERVLDVRLFERTTRGVVPTAQGTALAQHCRTILATLERAREDMDAISAGAHGRIALGVLLVAAPVLVPRALIAFKRDNPRVTVTVHEGTLGTLLPLLHRGDLDLVVGRLTADFASEGLHFEEGFDEPMAVVARRGHRLARKRKLSLADLAGEAWILPTREAAYRNRIDAAFRRQGVEPPVHLVESMSILTNATLLKDSDMLGVMPRNVARHYARAGAIDVLPIAVPPPSGPVGIITRSEGASQPALRGMVEALRASLAALARET